MSAAAPTDRRATRIVVLVSGGGTNLQAILDAIDAGELNAEVVAVVANRADAYGLERARLAGIEAVHVPVDGRSRAIYDGVLSHVVAGHSPDLVVLAGWMRILTNAFLSKFDVINLHPALPGAFAGLQAIERTYAAWQAGEVESGGVMIHRVPDEGVDDGPVIVSEALAIAEGDTLQDYEAAVHRAEHRLIVAAIKQITESGAP